MSRFMEPFIIGIFIMLVIISLQLSQIAKHIGAV